MNTKDTFLTAVDTFIDVASSTELNIKLIDQAKEYANHIRDYRVLVPVVGSFNVGKTSLINAYLNLSEERGLPTDIVPKTALATEIYRVSGDSEEKIEIFDQDETEIGEFNLRSYRDMDLNGLQKLPGNASFARAFLRSNVLNFDSQIVIVDMPGLDSGIRSHNEAIQRYLPLGSYFILVLDIERGTLRESEILQLREFLSQDIECSLFLNKADRKGKESFTVLEHVKAQVNNVFGKKISVHSVSALNGDFAAFTEALEAIDPELAMKNYWRQRLLDLFDLANISLHTRYNAINFSSSDADQKINELKQEQEKLENKLSEDEQDIRTRFSDVATKNIVIGVRDEIRVNSVLLANKYMNQGISGFEIHLNKLVRYKLNRLLHTAILKTRQDIEMRYQANIHGLETHINSIVEYDPSIRFKAGENFFRAIKRVAELSAQEFDSAAKQLGSNSDPGYKSIANSLRLATSLVTPWLEVVFTIVPWILGELGKSNQKQRQLKKLQLVIENDIAPKVASNLRQVVTEDYTALTDKELTLLREGMNGQIERVKYNIKMGQAVKDTGKQEEEKRKGELVGAVRKLSEARKSIVNE